MPAVAIAGAVLADVAASGAVGAVISGGLGALTLTGALEITAAVGATLGAVGVVTHDKGLTMAGTILGGIGGIGSLAASAGLFGADAGTASLFGSSSDAAASTAAPGAATGAATGATAGSGDIVDSLGAVDPTKVVPGASAAAPTGQGVTNSILSGGTGTSVPSTAPAAAASDAVAGMPKEVPLAPTLGIAAPGPAAPASPLAKSIADAGGAVAPTAPAVASPGVIGGISDFIKQNPTVSYGLIQAGGSLVGGLFDPVAPAQVKALDAQAAVNQQAANLSATQQANMAQPLPVAAMKAPTGIINTPTGMN